MMVTCDPVKRNPTLVERNLDFARADEVFAGHHFTRPDLRKDYGEQRFVTVGKLDGRMVVMVWTLREEFHRIISFEEGQ